jgi:uncharacterized protein (TIGR02246 family)
VHKFQREIIEVLKAYQAAVLAKDADAFMRLYDEDVLIFDAWGAWSHKGIAAWRNAVSQWFTSLGRESVAVNADEVRIFGTQDFAAMSAIVTYAATAPTGESPRALENRLTWALTRRGDGWKIHHEHTSAPIDHSQLKAILHRGEAP